MSLAVRVQEGLGRTRDLVGEFLGQLAFRALERGDGNPQHGRSSSTGGSLAVKDEAMQALGTQEHAPRELAPTGSVANDLEDGHARKEVTRSADVPPVVQILVGHQARLLQKRRKTNFQFKLSLSKQSQKKHT